MGVLRLRSWYDHALLIDIIFSLFSLTFLSPLFTFSLHFLSSLPSLFSLLFSLPIGCLKWISLMVFCGCVFVCVLVGAESSLGKYDGRYVESLCERAKGGVLNKTDQPKGKTYNTKQYSSSTRQIYISPLGMMSQKKYWIQYWHDIIIFYICELCVLVCTGIKEILLPMLKANRAAMHKSKL